MHLRPTLPLTLPANEAWRAEGADGEGDGDSQAKPQHNVAGCVLCATQGKQGDCKADRHGTARRTCKTKSCG